MEAFIACSDLHGVEQDAKAVAAFKRHVEDLKPKHRYFLGDLWNFAALRRQADSEEKNIRLKEDFDAGLDFLNWYRPEIFVWGNHDQRLLDSITRERVNRTGWLAELAETYYRRFTEFASSRNIRVLYYDKAKGTIRVGDITLAHGFGAGDTLGPRMASTYGNVMFGHGHRIERTPVMQNGNPVTAYQIGCLCRDDMDYARADLGALKQENGWAYGQIGKRSEIFQARYSNGRAIVASDFKVI